MKSEVIAIYETKTGHVAFEVVKWTSNGGRTGYRFNGKCGAGCGSLDDIATNIRLTMKSKRGIKFVSGTDIAA